MAARSEGKPQEPGPRLYLVTPEVEDASALARVLPDILGAADIAAVLLRLTEADERTLIARVKAIAPVVQDRGVALLLDGHAEIVAKSGADGAHLTGVEALKAALPSLKPARIAGAGGLKTRHDAILAGEAGADYAMFGEPEGGRRPPFSAIVERVAWWAEVFQPPCVGFAESVDEVAALAHAGADFVALGEFVFSDPSGPRAMVEAAAARLVVAEPAR